MCKRVAFSFFMFIVIGNGLSCSIIVMCTALYFIVELFITAGKKNFSYVKQPLGLQYRRIKSIE